MKIQQHTLDWLLSGDPSVQWQVMRDLLGEKPEIYHIERSKIAKNGWGKELLLKQDPTGTWGKGLYSPKWISTTYSMLTLRRLGLAPDNPAAQIGCKQLLEGGFYEPDGGINFSASYKYSETCITGMVLSILAYFIYPDSRVHRLKDHLLTQQMPDGGWNCRSYLGDTHSSFHTTIAALEGLLIYQQTWPDSRKGITAAREKAHEFLLQHRLYRSHRTGDIVNPRMTRFPFPPRWFYDFLRALDYFQSAKATQDQRLEDPINLLFNKGKNTQRWPAYRGPSGKVFFDLEPAGEPSRMNTLRALRVLKWWYNP
ncbi:MAG: hypothetical protein WBB69_05445 [Anaerolineales bacterium]